ncbi:hypothetical protein D3C87_1961150 [compost metagenome]
MARHYGYGITNFAVIFFNAQCGYYYLFEVSGGIELGRLNFYLFDYNQLIG